MKELPYFRFTVSEWLNDDISLESYELKGLFIDICCYYWFKDCTVSKSQLNKRFANAEQLISELFSIGIIKEKHKDFIHIKFLDIQYEKAEQISSVRSKAAKSKGLKKKHLLNKSISNGQQKHIYKDKDKEKDNNTKKHFFENSPYFDKAKFKERFPDWSTDKLKHYWESAKDYSDAHGKKYKDWISAIRGWDRKDPYQEKGLSV